MSVKTIVIDRLGRHGDGIAMRDGGRVFVPLTLAGEQVIADVNGDRGDLIQVLRKSTDRTAPVCPHFGQCGGCALQHFDAQAAACWKAGLIEDALAANGLDAPVRNTVTFPDQGRRRAVFKARRTKKTLRLGFHGRRSDQIIPIQTCSVLHPKIVALLPGLARLLWNGLTRRGAAGVSVLWSASGADIAVEGGRELDLRLCEHLGVEAQRLALARLSWNGELVVSCEIPPLLQFGPGRVTPPPGGFVQAVEAAERSMSNFVQAWLKPAKNTVDLFAGCGTFSLPLAQTSSVLAVDFDRPALDALEAGAAQTSHIRPVRTLKRNLFNDPLRADELAGFDAAVFDPPRAGARAQCSELAKSGLIRIAAISCNPVSFARDARILVDGGFKLVEVIPVDQFKYAPHIELSALFTRS